ncbi:MAG: NAD-dependent epimerase/dehydratase family protein, partial [Bacteroidales bacterium]|nr:NAD-dependent epimerase/dehydratase family protein [Bacteroidales bacterium]
MILVTGGTGLVGSHLLFELLSRGKDVRAIRRHGSRLDSVCRIFQWYAPDQPELFSRIQWVDGDVCDPTSLDEAFEGVDEVYHCAAFVSFRRSDYDLIGSVNIRGTSNVVDACLYHGVKRLCHVSSIAALGTSEDGKPVDERTPWNSGVRHSPYGLSKFAAEREVWRGIEEGLEAVIVNPSVILGPGEPHKASCRLFAAIERGMAFYPPGANGFVDVRDVARTMVLLMEKGMSGQRYVISGGNHGYRDVFSAMAGILGTKAPRYKVPAIGLKVIWRFNAVISYLLRINAELTRETARNAYITAAYDNTKIRGILNFEFTSLEDTLLNVRGFCTANREYLYLQCR